MNASSGSARELLIGAVPAMALSLSIPRSPGKRRITRTANAISIRPKHGLSGSPGLLSAL
jgi:hypothetical protein